MTTEKQTFRITDWNNYAVSILGDTSEMAVTTVTVVSNNRTTKITTYLDWLGNGYETREYTSDNLD